MVMLGGGVGSALRFLVAHYLGQSSNGFPVSTLVVNFAGCFVLGCVSGYSIRVNVSNSVLLLLGTGLCGGFTTMSAFSIENLNLLRTGHIDTALLYVMVTLIGCTALAFVGGFIGRNLTL